MALGRVVTVILGAGLPTLSVNVLFTEPPPASLRVSSNSDSPTAVGVPEITPVEEFRRSPLGREPELLDQLSVPPFAAVPLRVVL